MADYDLGTARGRIEIDYNDGGSSDRARRDLDSVRRDTLSTSDAFNKVANAAIVGGAGIVGGLALAVKSVSDFETQISAIGAVSGATGAQLDTVRNKALQLGKDTVFSASDAAEAMTELVKAGVSLPDVMNGAADATVALAAAGGVDLPQAATIAANAMNQFGLAAKDLPHVADLIAGAANASAIDVHDFGMSLAQSGAVAKLAGLSFDDLTIGIAEMGNAGIKGSDAGTSLKTMFSNLIPTTKQQIGLFQDMGLMTKDGTNLFYDQTGKLKSLRDIQELLGKSTANMTAEQKQAALYTIFGSDAIRAAAVLANNGAAGYDKLSDSINKTKAADVAKQRMDNLGGSLEQMKGSIETASIELGEIMLPYIRQLVDHVTGLVNWFGSLDKGTQKLIVTIAAITAGVLLSLGALIKIVRGVQEVIAVMKILGAAMAANPFFIWIAVLIAVGVALYELYKHSETFRNIVNAVWKSVREVFMTTFNAIKNFITKDIPNAFNSFISFMKQWGLLFLGPIGAIIKYWDDIVAFFKAIPGKIMDALKALPMLLLNFVGDALKALGFVIGYQLGLIVKFFINLPGWIMDALSGLETLLKNIGEGIMNGLLDGVKLGWKLLVWYYTELPGLILDFFVSAATWLLDVGKSVIVGFYNGNVAAAEQLWSWLTALPGVLLAFFSAAPQWLYDVGSNVIHGFIDGITAIWDTVSGWIGGLISGFISGFKSALGISSPSTIFMSIGRDVIQGLLNGIQAVWTNVMGWLSQVGGWIIGGFAQTGTWLSQAGQNVMRGFLIGIQTIWQQVSQYIGNMYGWVGGTFSNAINWLINAGKAVMQGLWNGMKSVWSSVTGWLKSLNPANWFNDINPYKGHAIKNLVGVGEQVFQGLHNGMKDEWSNVQSWLRSLDPSGEIGGGNAASLLAYTAQPAANSAMRSGAYSAQVTATGAAPMGTDGTGVSGDYRTFNFNTYNPNAEKASDSEARRIRALSAIGAF